MPVRVVVPLLGTLEAVTSARIVLAGVDCRVAVQLLIGEEEALIALAGLAQLVPANGLVNT
jgi:hypothetical protein